MGIDIAFGSVGLNNVVYTSGNTQKNNISPSQLRGNSSIISVRVKKIILDNSDIKIFQQFGEWNSIGTIFWEAVDKPMPGDSYSENLYAFPIFPNIKHYPLVNEIVYLLQLTNTNIATDLSANSYYYFPPLNIWNSQIHNAIPGYDNDPSNDESQRVDYRASFQGEIRQITDNSSEINLGKTFIENFNIHPLLPYEGDIIYEGRWGNSIRLGSTVKNSFIPNQWSTTGENGDPITILRNGQRKTFLDPWIPITENIDEDLSSIYLTSTQLVPINIASTSNLAFTKSTSPSSPGLYTGNQIILNSGRLLFNAKNDSIILSSNKSIQLTCNETLGVDAKQIALEAEMVYLGSSQGVEGKDIQSVVLGENLNFILSDISTFLQTLTIAFKTATDSNGAPIVSLQSIASDAETLSNDILNIVNNKNLLSTRVKIKV